LKATKIYKNQVVIFCFCSNEMQPCRIWGAKQKTESVAPRASTKLKKEQIALFFAFFSKIASINFFIMILRFLSRGLLCGGRKQCGHCD
jgi:hypothetical protein